MKTTLCPAMTQRVHYIPKGDTREEASGHAGSTPAGRFPRCELCILRAGYRACRPHL